MKSKRVNTKNNRSKRRSKRSSSNRKTGLYLVLLVILLGIAGYGLNYVLNNRSAQNALGEVKFKKIKSITLNGCGETANALYTGIANYNSAPNGKLNLKWKTDIRNGQKLGTGLYQQGVSTKGTYITQNCEIEKKCGTMTDVDRMPGTPSDWERHRRTFQACKGTEQQKYFLKNTKAMKKIHKASIITVKACRTTNNPANTVRLALIANRVYDVPGQSGTLGGYNVLTYLGFDGKIQRKYYDEIDKENDTTRFASQVISASHDNINRELGGENGLNDYAMSLNNKPKLKYYNMGIHEIRGYYKSVNKGQKNPWVVVGFAGNVQATKSYKMDRVEFTKKVRFNTLPKCKNPVLLKPDWGIKESQL